MEEEGKEANGLMQVKCAWCGKLLHRKHHHEPVVSHGICKSCAHKIRVEVEKDSKDKVTRT